MLIRRTMLALLAGLMGAAPVSAEFRVERKLALPPGGQFILETEIGGVTITGDSTSGAVITVAARRDDFDQRFDVRFEESAGTARVVVKRRGSWFTGFWSSIDDTAHFTIRLPQKTSVTVNTAGGAIAATRLVGTARVRTSGGSLRLEDIEGPVDGSTSGGSIRISDVGGDVVAHTSGGGINVADVRGRLEAHTSGGGIQIDGVSGDLSASTSGGGVSVRGAGGYVEARSSGGPIAVTFTAKNGRGGDLSTSGGGVRAEVDPNVALSIDARSSGGRVSSDLPVTVRGAITSDALNGDLNGGGPALRLRSSGGGVQISRTAMTATSR